MKTILVLYFLGVLVAITSSCELMNKTLFSQCAELGYNMTKYPTMNGLVNQKEASAQLEEFIPGIKKNCSVFLLPFLCSYYAPICYETLDGDITLDPCESLCDKIYDDCSSFLTGLNLTWPEHLQCYNFWSNGSKDCFGPENVTDIHTVMPTISSFIATSSYIIHSTQDEGMTVSTVSSQYQEYSLTTSDGLEATVSPKPTDCSGSTASTSYSTIIIGANILLVLLISMH